MKNKVRILSIIVGLFLFHMHMFSQTHNYSGVWILNPEKSKLEFTPDGLTGSVFIINQDGDKFKLTRYHIYGNKRRKMSFKMNFGNYLVKPDTTDEQT